MLSSEGIRFRGARISNTDFPGIRAAGCTDDGRDRLATVIDPMSRTAQMFYDTVGRVTRQVLADAREILYAYDANGNLTSGTWDITGTLMDIAGGLFDTHAYPWRGPYGNTSSLHENNGDNHGGRCQ